MYNYDIIILFVSLCSELLDSGVVGANILLDQYSPCSALVRVCENGLTKFAKALIDHGADVSG